MEKLVGWEKSSRDRHKHLSLGYGLSHQAWRTPKHSVPTLGFPLPLFGKATGKPASCYLTVCNMRNPKHSLELTVLTFPHIASANSYGQGSAISCHSTLSLLFLLLSCLSLSCWLLIFNAPLPDARQSSWLCLPPLESAFRWAPDVSDVVSHLQRWHSHGSLSRRRNLPRSKSGSVIISESDEHSRVRPGESQESLTPPLEKEHSVWMSCWSWKFPTEKSQVTLFTVLRMGIKIQAFKDPWTGAVCT